jgi:Phosphoinositide phospholipase C, Ca2+-dependent
MGRAVYIHARFAQLALLASLVALVACGTTDGAEAGPSDDAEDEQVGDEATEINDLPPFPLDDLLRLNHVQVRGTHNSYHVAPPAGPASYLYTHPPLDVQLDAHGVRQIELDVYYVPGGAFQVFHGFVGDDGTTCPDLDACFALVRGWEVEHPDHLPIMMMIEVKGIHDGINAETIAESAVFEALEARILVHWPLEALIRPDDVRGNYASLREALDAEGWPTLGEVRGRDLFILNTTSARAYIRDAYLADHPSLENRLLFVRDGEGEPFSAILELGDPVRDRAHIEQAVADGYLVRTTADGAGESDEDNQAGAEAALASGAHFISTDLLEPTEGRDYYFPWPVPGPARCNPITSPATCDDDLLEP